MANLYDKAGLVNIPVGYQQGFLYNIKPEDNTLGFRFNRDSAATLVNSKGLIEQVGYFGPELVKNGNFSELGSELVTNGDFVTDSDWTKGTGWTISNGKANCDGSQTSQTTLQSVSNLALGSGNLFKITFNISNYLSGEIDLITLVGTGGPEIIDINSNGSYTAYSFGASTGDAKIQIIANSDFIGSIDNVSVKQVDPNNYWILAGSNVSISNNKLNFVNATTNSEFAQQIIVAPIGNTYKITLEVSNLGSGESIKIRHPFQDTTINTNGFHAIYGVGDLANIFRITPNSTTATFSVTNISVIEVKGDKPRIDYTDSLTSPSFLLEPQSTNLLTFSENLKNYENSNTVCTSNYAISPDGTKNATRVDFTASSTNALGVNGAVNNGETITQSVFVKYIDAQFVQLWFGSSGFGGGNTNFDLINGTTSNPSGSSSSMKKMGNGWWRISSTRTATSTASNTGIFKLVVVDSLTSSRFGDEANGSVLAFGGQYEQKSYATSYIPTAGSTVTRAQETCTGAGSASTFNSTEGVLYAEIAALADDGITRRFSISDGTNNNRVLIGFSSSNRFQFVVSDGGSVVVNQLITVSDITEFNKVAISYKLNDCVIWINGQEVGTDTSATMPSGLNTLNFNQGSATENFYGKTKGIYVFNEALTDDELQQLTGPEYNSFAALAAAYNYTVI